MQITGVKVLGDHGETYEVSANADNATCTCLAFRFKPAVACKHIQYVARVLTRATGVAVAPK